MPGYILGNHLNRLTAILDALIDQGGQRVIVTMPPRHGKSYTASELFPGYFIGRAPDKRLILASYSAGLSQKFSRSVRNTVDSVRYQTIFPGVRLAQDSRSTSVWDVADRRGGMIAAGVGGGITGHGADLLIIDDPIKDAREADSQLVRDRLWDWYTTTAYTRLHPGGSVLVIATRWHEDDLIGRLIDQTEDNPDADHWTILHFPAIWDKATEQAQSKWREKGHEVASVPEIEVQGSALWPARYPADALRGIEATVGSRTWNALYQGRPQPPEGSMFKRSWFQVVGAGIREADRVRYWDKAATEDGGAYTCGVLMSRARNGQLFVEDVVRGQWSEFERERTIRQMAELDRQQYGPVNIWIEQEPGSGGADSVRATIRNLVGFNARADRPHGDKVLRAQPLAAQAEALNVFLVRGDWNAKFLEELASFPHGTRKDQVDAASGALSKLSVISKSDMRKAI